MSACRRPVLALVSGAPGSGKTILSHALARRLEMYRVNKAEIGRALDVTDGSDTGNHDRAWETYWTLLETLVGAGASVVADQTTWREQCDPIIASRLLPKAAVCIVHCSTRLAHDRWLHRLTHTLGMGAEEVRALCDRMASRRWQFEGPLPLGRPVLTVDTSDGYSPGIDRIVEFVSAQLGPPGDPPPAR